MWFLRKVNLAKWTTQPGHGLDSVPADAVTLCLRTSSNKLSFWSYEEGDLEEAKLAFLAAQDRIDRAQLVVLPRQAFDGLRLENEPNATAYEARERTHFDVAALDHHGLVRVAQLVGAEVYGERHILMPKAEVKALLLAGIADGRVKREKLHKDILAELPA